MNDLHTAKSGRFPRDAFGDPHVAAHAPLCPTAALDESSYVKQMTPSRSLDITFTTKYCFFRKRGNSLTVPVYGVVYFLAVYSIFTNQRLVLRVKAAHHRLSA